MHDDIILVSSYSIKLKKQLQTEIITYSISKRCFNVYTQQLYKPTVLTTNAVPLMAYKLFQ